MSKAEYKSAIRSRRLIRQAFLELIQEKEVGKITVTDIVKRADINRGTFYAHYRDVQAVIEEIEKEIMDKLLEFLSKIKDADIISAPLPILLEVSAYLEKDKEFYRVLINVKGSDSFIEKLKKVFISYMKTVPGLLEKISCTEDFLNRAYFFAGGIANLYQAWFRGEIGGTLEDIAYTINDMAAAVCLIFQEKLKLAERNEE